MNYAQFLPRSWRKAIAFFTGVSFVTAPLYGVFFSSAYAAVTTNSAANAVNFNSQTMGASSAAKAILGLNTAQNAGETLASVRISLNATSSFTTADFAALGTATSSGIALYQDNKTAGTFGSFDAADFVVPLSVAPAFSDGVATTTPATSATVPANDLGVNAGSDFFIVARSSGSAVNGHAFSLTVGPGNINYSANTPTATPASATSTNVTIDTVAPTVDVSRTAPSNGATNVPVSAFINASFSENIDAATINGANVTLTTGGTPVPIGYRTFPDGFNLIISSPPTYESGSRFAKVASTSQAFFQINGTNPIYPQGTYASTTLGDIVYFQHDTFPMEVGIVTNATLTSGTFAVNGFTPMGGKSITKFAAASTTGLVTAATAVYAGDLLLANTSANPTGDRYAWHIVTTGAAVNNASLRLDGSGAAPTYIAGSSFSSLTPADSSAVNGSSQVVGSAGGGIDLTVGDLLFAKVTTGGDNLNTYAWHLVTGADTITTDRIPGTLLLDGSSASTTLAANSYIAKLSPGGVQGPVTNTTTVFNYGDLILAKTLANAANNGQYALHMVSNGGTGANSTSLRLDNVSSNLNPSTSYTLSIGTGVADQAGNPLASTQTISFTTGSTGGTDLTPPFITSSNPQGEIKTSPQMLRSTSLSPLIWRLPVRGQYYHL